MRFLPSILAGIVWSAVSLGVADEQADIERQMQQIRFSLRTQTTDVGIESATALIEKYPKSAKAHQFRASLYMLARDQVAAEKDLTKAIELDPRDVESYQRRGETRFRLADIAGSVADFDAVLERAPQSRPGHWQRGISLYYAGKYADGVEQFDAHQTVNPQDVENAVWRFLCMVKIEGVDKSRAKLFKIDADRRIPMREIFAMFAGTGTPEAVLEAANRPQQLQQRQNMYRFYANLYLGLYFEALGQAAKSLEYIEKAASDPAQLDYMGDVARTHYKLRKSGVAASVKDASAKPVKTNGAAPKGNDSTKRGEGKLNESNTSTAGSGSMLPAKRETGGQNPSPMVEHSRTHPRLTQQSPPGRREKLQLGTLFIPKNLLPTATATSNVKPTVPLFVHFHGGSWLPEVAAAKDGRFAAIAVQLGSGSSTYAKPFTDPTAFDRLIAEAESKSAMHFSPIGLTAWSAGYGSVRAILAFPKWYDAIAFVVLIDGMHTGYVGGKPGPLESKIEPAGLEIFLKFARDAVAGKKRMIVTHSEIFPGTFASTTETSDWLIAKLDLKRTPTLEWGPMGTQQLSEVKAGKLLIKGYAGNSAPDHVDQLHSLGDYLRWVD